MRRAAKVDANHGDVMRALEAAGIWAVSTAALGNGFPDILTCHRGTFRLLEVKDGSKPPSQRQLTDAEAAFFRACPGPVHLVNSPLEALQAHGIRVAP